MKPEIGLWFSASLMSTSDRVPVSQINSSDRLYEPERSHPFQWERRRMLLVPKRNKEEGYQKGT